MVMRGDVGDREPDRYAIEEWRLRERDAFVAKIPGDVKRELEFADAHRVIGEQRRRRTTFRIGVNRSNRANDPGFDGGEVDAHARSRRSVRGIENVRRELAHRHRSLGAAIAPGSSKPRSLRHDAR